VHVSAFIEEPWQPACVQQHGRWRVYVRVARRSNRPAGLETSAGTTKLLDEFEFEFEFELEVCSKHLIQPLSGSLFTYY